MDLGYRNVMINNTTGGRMTTRDWVDFFLYISVIRSWHNVGKSGNLKKWVWHVVYIFHGNLFSS